MRIIKRHNDPKSTVVRMVSSRGWFQTGYQFFGNMSERVLSS